MMEKEVEIRNLDELVIFARNFIHNLDKYSVFLLCGQMGAGKTTFIQNLFHEIGIKNLEGSPTYSLINAYENEKYGEIYHLDLYRIKNENELFDIGIEELLDKKAFLFIEWPELIKPFISNIYLEIHISLMENNSRKIILVEKAN